MKPATDEASLVDLILGYFGWNLSDVPGRYHVVRFLRLCRGEAVPTYDDFAARGHKAA